MPFEPFVRQLSGIAKWLFFFDDGGSNAMISKPPALEQQANLLDHLAERQSDGVDAGPADPLITLFAVPKPFGTRVDTIQKNAIRSWARLKPRVDVLLLGDGEGIALLADELGLRHSPDLDSNHLGTPLIDSAFKVARQNSTTPILMYCNSDIILCERIVMAIERLHRCELKQFVAFGRRTDLPVEREFTFDHEGRKQLEQMREKSGRPCSVVCKEFFAFTRDAYPSIPAFAIGRGNWDNWMLHSAKQRGVPVVDISSQAGIIHQSHDYSHMQQGRWSCYAAGEEATENQRLAGGRHLISGSTGTWRLEDDGLKRIPLAGLNWSFWADLPRFLRLMRDLMTDR
jgi:hypothetical protein